MLIFTQTENNSLLGLSTVIVVGHDLCVCWRPGQNLIEMSNEMRFSAARLFRKLAVCLMRKDYYSYDDTLRIL